MAIQTTILNRTFAYSGLTLPDPGKGLSLGRNRDVDAATYPELISASDPGAGKEGGQLGLHVQRAWGRRADHGVITEGKA